jgi:hypothetical protein
MKKSIKTNTVTDEQGRTRFHGAFTGGFSAGYFNTVGSSEGFKPTQFVSSRSRRADVSIRSVANYMDEGDGLLGGKLSTNLALTVSPCRRVALFGHLTKQERWVRHLGLILCNSSLILLERSC